MNRWWQFSIRDLFWFIAVVACIAFARNERWVSNEAVKEIRRQADDLVREMHHKFGSEKIAEESAANKWKQLYEDCQKDRQADKARE